GGRELSVRDIGHDALAEADRVEVAPVLAQRDLGKGSGFDIIDERLGDAPVCMAAQVLDAGDAPGDSAHERRPPAAAPALSADAASGRDFTHARIQEPMHEAPRFSFG